MAKIENFSIFEFQIQNTNTRLQAEYILLTRQSQARANFVLRATAGGSFNQANWDQRTAISATVVNRAKAANKSVYDIITKYDYYRGINEQKAKDVLEKLKDFKGGSDMREKLSGKEVSYRCCICIKRGRSYLWCYRI